MKTMLQMRDDMADSLGIPSLKAQDSPTRWLLTNFLQRAQNWLYWAYNWETLRTVATITSVSSQSAYPFPTTMEARKLIDVSSTKSGVSTALREGVPPEAKNGTTAPAAPTRFWLAAGNINFWPAPDSVSYTFYLDGYESLGPFAVATDTATLDDEAIMEFAIANAKYHMGQADGPMYVQLVNSLIARLNSSNEATGRQEFLLMPPGRSGNLEPPQEGGA